MAYKRIETPIKTHEGTTRRERRKQMHSFNNRKRRALVEQHRDGLTQKAVAQRKKMKAHRRRNGRA